MAPMTGFVPIADDSGTTVWITPPAAFIRALNIQTANGVPRNELIRSVWKDGHIVLSFADMQRVVVSFSKLYLNAANR